MLLHIPEYLNILLMKFATIHNKEESKTRKLYDIPKTEV